MSRTFQKPKQDALNQLIEDVKLLLAEAVRKEDSHSLHTETRDHFYQFGRRTAFDRVLFLIDLYDLDKEEK